MKKAITIFTAILFTVLIFVSQKVRGQKDSIRNEQSAVQITSSDSREKLTELSKTVDELKTQNAVLSKTVDNLTWIFSVFAGLIGLVLIIGTVTSFRSEE